MQDFERKYIVTIATLWSHTITLVFFRSIPIDDYMYQIWPPLLKYCGSNCILKVLVKLWLPWQHIIHQSEKICLAPLHLNVIIYSKFHLNCLKIEGDVHNARFWNNVHGYHGNALIPYYDIDVFQNYNYRWLCVQNLTSIAQILWQILHTKCLGKILVTMATHNPKITKNVSCSSTPQCHYIPQVSFELL